MKKKRRAEKNNQRSVADHAASIVMGRNAVNELVRNCPSRVKRMLVSDNIKNSSTRAKDLFAVIQANDIPIEEVPSSTLSTLAGSENHQSFIAILKKRSFEDLDDFLERVSTKAKSLVLVLDEVSDPQNLGAILRASECMGVDAVIWSRNRGTGLSPVVSKVSVGASELLTLIEVGNLVEAIKKIKQQDFWLVAADADETAEDVRHFTFPEKTVLIMGSEHKGIKRLMLSQCDFKVKIPLFGKIDSLNVSQATAVLLYAYRCGKEIT